MKESTDDKADGFLDAAINNELQQARERAASLEQRALAVVTTSGVLVGLIFGFATLVKGRAGISFSTPARYLLALALLAFIAAAISSLLTIRPRSYLVKKDLEKLITNRTLTDDGWDSIAKLRVQQIEHWENTNKPKADWLQAAIGAECFGITLLAVSMLVIVL
jgi:hypothetical protein